MPPPQSTLRAAPGQKITVYAAHEGRLPPLGDYLRELWTRRSFIVQLARTQIRASHTDTFFGKLWQVLNPLLLGLVYYLVWGMLTEPAPGYLPFLMGGLFLYYYTRNAMGMGAGSVVNGGGLLMNSSFPRAVLPLSATLSALYGYMPTIPVFLAFHLFDGGRLTPTMLLVPLLLVVFTMFNFGVSMLAAVMTVYFRDTSSFLPYLLRIWLYLSPILWTLDDLRDQFPPTVTTLVTFLNPLVPYLETWHRLVDGFLPTPKLLIAMIGWAILMPVIGGGFFLSREREFAVRV